MQVLFETEVTPDQIDHLGHMNVMYYGAHARTGAASLLAKIGLDETPDASVYHRDTYVRHHNEQLEGAPLEIRGGVLDVGLDRIRLYEELANTDTGAIAAAFVLSFDLVDPATRDPRPIPDDVLTAARGLVVELPEHGRSRSISLDGDPTATAPSLAKVRELELAERMPRTVDASMCGDDGVVEPSRVADLVWGGTPTPDHIFRPMEPLENGNQMGFATMETRATWARPVRVGDKVQSFGAELAIHDKAMVSRHWVYDLDREDVVAAFSVVSLGFDIGARRAISIPAAVRERMERRLHPELVTDRPA